MLERFDLLFYKLRYVTFCLFVIVLVLAIALGASFIANASVKAEASDGSSSLSASSLLESDGIQTNLYKFSEGVQESLHSVGLAIGGVGTSVGSSVSKAGHGVGGGLAATFHFFGRGGVYIGRTVVGSLSTAARAPLNIVGFVADKTPVSSIIKPGDRASLPTIDSQPATLAAATPLPAAQAANPAPPPAPAGTIWPIHGSVTTEFGVPHWPFQPVHTGIDITDGHPAGVTPIVPFKSGQVVRVVRSSSGFGNHVILEHGNGLTSLYGHLASISVIEGEIVSQNTVLGKEGSTGASTGTHLHFEVRLNGQPVNPAQYVVGRP